LRGFGDAAGVGMRGWRGAREGGGSAERVETLSRMLRDRSALRCAGVYQVGEMNGGDDCGG